MQNIVFMNRHQRTISKEEAHICSMCDMHECTKQIITMQQQLMNNTATISNNKILQIRSKHGLWPLLVYGCDAYLGDCFSLLLLESH